MLNTIYILPIFCKQYYTFTTHHSILPFITFIDFNQNSRHIFVETKLNNMNLKKWLNKNTKPTTVENTYTPPMGVNDANRKQHFTTYNVELMNEIRRIKLNEVNK